MAGRDERQIALTRLNYPPGARVELIEMLDDPNPIPRGMRGVVQSVDGAGHIMMEWDNGRSLSLIPGVDNFRKLTQQEILEEQNTRHCGYPVLFGYAGERMKELNNVTDVAKFIYEEGLRDNVLITTPDGKPFISTFGIFLNRIADTEYRDQLLKELLPLQMGDQHKMDEMSMD